MRGIFLLLTPVLLAATDPAQWPKWRGPENDGVARTAAPVEWSETKNIAWKTPIPGRGHSSPVIWGDRIYLTTAVPQTKIEGAAGGNGPGGGYASGVEHRFVVMALNRKDGKVAWEKTLLTATPHEGYHFRYGSFASNSPVTDGKHLFAFFGSRGIYAMDLDGKPVWEKKFGAMRMRLGFGEGVPTVLHEDRLLLNFDQEDGSYLMVLDKNTGKEIWKVERDEPSSWSPPTVVTVGGRKQIVISATKRVRSYDYATGKLIWECAGLGSNVIPAPVVHKDTVIVMSGHRDPNRMAIKLGRDGNLTGTDAILWQNTKGNSYSASPVLHNGRLYFVTDNGILNAVNATTGDVIYTERLPGTYSLKASPVAAGGNLYISTEQGDVVVVKLGDKYEVLSTNKMGDEFFIATPAVADGEMYLRGRNMLYAVRSK